MSKRMIAACVAALGLAACDETKPLPPKTITFTQTKQAVPTPRLEVSPIAVVPAQRDAGLTVTQVQEAADTLSLAHDTPLVDHFARAKQLRTDADSKGALAEARRALFTSPNDDEVLEFIAQVARKTGQPAMAAEAWGRVATLRPDDALPCIQQARMLYQARDFAGTVMSGRDAIARDEGNADGFHLVGLGQLAMGELGGAIESFSKAVDIEPAHGWALNNLGFAYLRANENEKAVTVLETASVLLPYVAYVQNNYGVALERTGRHDEAKAAYQHAMDLSPKYVKARINAARVAKMETELIEDGDPEIMSDLPHPMPEP